MINPFQWKDGKAMTPEEVDRQRKLAEAALGRAGDTSPVGHWTQGAARVLDTLGGVIKDKRASKAEAAGLAGAEDYISNSPVLAALIGGGGYANGGNYAPGSAPFTGGGSSPVAQPDGLNLGTDVPPEELAAIQENSVGSWNGGPISSIRPEAFSTFGVGSGPDTQYDLGTSAANTPDAAFREELLAAGLPEHAVDGIMMNAHDESAFNPVAVGDGGNAFGLLQWNGPRKRALMDWAASQGLDPADPRTQAKFTVYELQGPESAAGRALLATSTPGEAGAAFVNLYERPAEGHRARREAAYLGGGGTLVGGDGMYTGGGMSSGGSPIPMSGGGANVTAALAAAMSDPWVAKKYGPVLDALMGQEMKRGNMQYEAQLRQADPMYQAQLKAAEAALQPAPMKPIEVGGVLLDPVTYQPLFDSRSAEPGFAMVSADEVAALGLPPGAYQRGGDGKITQVGGGGVTVNNNMGEDAGRYLYGTDAGVPAGWRVDRETGQASPIPGGPADVEARALEDKKTNAQNQGQLKLGTTLDSLNLNIAEIENGGLPVTGAIGDARRSWLGRALTGSGAMDFGNRSSQITDSAALAEIQNMRDNSPTGGAVGQLTDGERVALGNARTAMNASTGPEEYVRAAKAYRKLALDLAYGEGMWRLTGDGQVEMVMGGGQAESSADDAGQGPVKISNDAEYDILPSGAQYIDPDGNLRVKS